MGTATHYNPITNLHYRLRGLEVHVWNETHQEWWVSNYTPLEFTRSKAMQRL